MTISTQITTLGARLFILISLLIQVAGARQAAKPCEVRGKLSLTKVSDEPRRQAQIDRYGTHKKPVTGSQAAAALPPTYRLSERAVVYLASEGFRGQKFSPPAARPVLNQKNLTFYPQVLPILVGTSVDFPNGDPLFHNVFSYSQPREFDLGRYPTGESRSVRFDHPGIVRVYCDIHAHMNATILVLDNPFFATPDDQGNYTIKNVPEGTYSLKVWYGREVIEERSLSVKSGETITVNIVH